MFTLTKRQQELLFYMYDNRSKGIIDLDIKKFYKNRISAHECLTQLKKQKYIYVKKDFKDRRKNVYFLSLRGIMLCFILTGVG